MSEVLLRGWKFIRSICSDALSHHRLKRRVRIHKYGNITDRPPPLHWAPCHASTIHRFKATMTCPHGHVFTLRIHSIKRDGSVVPSVVCPAEDCSFHAYVRLSDWSFGLIP